MYDLPQSGILANKLLKKRLTKHGYFELHHTPCLFKYVTRPVAFTLVVENFKGKYVGKQPCRSSNGGNMRQPCGGRRLDMGIVLRVKLNWEYEHGYIDISMPDYEQE